MLEINGNIWDDPTLNVICILTNGTVKSNGENIMGGGIALEAAIRIPHLPKHYGSMINSYGLHLQAVAIYEKHNKNQIILAFPTKYHISFNADTKLIMQSFTELQTFCNIFPMYRIGLPRPGSGLGGLEWNKVKDILQYMWDNKQENRLVIYNNENK